MYGMVIEYLVSSLQLGTCCGEYIMYRCIESFFARWQHYSH